MLTSQDVKYFALQCGARGCTRACLDHLDKKGVLSKKFKYPFRDRKPWMIMNPEKED